VIAMLIATTLAGSAVKNDLARLTQRQLNEISAKCGTPKAWLRSRDGEVHVRPSHNAKDAQVDCILAELRSHHSGPMGFVGNEIPN
jgi:hypothetical protein